MVGQPARSNVDTLVSQVRSVGARHSLGGWFAAFALTLCCAIIAAFVANAIHERTVATNVARAAAANLAESLAQQAAETFEATDGALRVISQRLERHGTGLPARIRLQDTMTGLIATLPRIHFLAVADEHGRFVVSSFAVAAGAKMPLFSDRPYFRYHRDHPGTGLHISGPARDKVDDAWVVFATRRINHPDGSFAGVAVAPISLDFFARNYSRVDVGHSGTITLFEEDGTIMMRAPLTSIGKRFHDAGLFVGSNAKRQAGWYVRESHIDRTLRLFAFRRLHDYPLAVQVGLAESEYLAEWGSDTRTHVLVLAAVLALAAGLAGTLGAQIARRKRAEEQLAGLAFLDGLTGLANRRQFDSVFEREWRRAARAGSALAVVMIDVDYFKAYNDMYGHVQGDTALVLIAQAIGAKIRRPGDLAARYGGEEFIMILPSTDVPGALTVAESIREAVAELNITHAASENGIAGVSIGVASTVPAHAATGSSLIAAADSALYAAKRAGRNRTSVANPAETVA